MNNQEKISDTNEAQSVLNQIVLAHLKEQKAKRRGRMVKYGVLVLVTILIAYQFFSFGTKERLQKNNPHVGVIDIEGTIFDGQSASADNLVKGLDAAYENEGLKALVLRINSPGGSPVQADYMFSAIQYYKKQHPNVKIYAVCVDLCASAAYYVAASADEIYANPASMVGSIGVVYNGFGFVDLMQKVGVSRRLQTAGINKGFLDPFSPVSEDQTKVLQGMLDTVHQQFINRVKEGRGSRLHETPEMFSGLIWTGKEAKVLGLVDDFASTGQLARDIIKIDSLVDYTFQPNFYEKLAKNMGTALADHLPQALGLKPGFQ